MSKRTALIDGDFFAYYILFNKKLEDGTVENKTFDECKLLLDEFLSTILEKTEADQYMIALTVGKNFRYTIFPDYKANRKGKEKPPFFNEFKEYLFTKYNAVAESSLEADDMVLIASKLIPDSIIVSPDKDILSLEGTHYNPRTNEFVTTNKEQAEYAFWCDMIAGQSGDGIKGLPEKGIKYAEKILDDTLQIGLLKHCVILNEYVNHFGEELGIGEFYKTYKCLKIKDVDINFDISKIKLNLAAPKEVF